MGSTLIALEQRILPLVTKPSRYIAPYAPPLAFDTAARRVVLLVPAPYESALARVRVRTVHQTLAAAGASVSGASLDLVFRPAADLTAALARENVPLFGLAARQPLSAFDVVVALGQDGFDLADILWMLADGGISPHRDARGVHDPLVLFAGDLAWHGSALAPHADGILLGDPEAHAATVWDLALHVRESGRDAGRRHLLTLAGPGESPDAPPSLGRWLDAPVLPRAPFAPLPEVAEDGLPAEVSRARGPARPGESGRLLHAPADAALAALQAAVADTGYSEVLLGAEASAHPELITILERFHAWGSGLGITARLLSADASRFSAALARELCKGARARLRFTPLFVSGRLRAIAGGDESDSDPAGAVEIASRGGWSQLSLAALYGAPGESEADFLEWDALLAEIAALPMRGPTAPRLVIEAKPWVPHPLSVFRGPLLGHDALAASRDRLRARAPKGGKVRFQDAPAEAAEAEVLLRSGTDAGRALLDRVAAARPDRPDAAPDAAHVWRGLLAQAPGGEDWRAVAPVPRADFPESPPAAPAARDSDDNGSAPAFGVPGWAAGRRVKRGGRAREARRSDRYRIQFAKGEPLRFTSHLDVARGLERAFRRAQLPVALSQGKDRRPRFSFGPPLPLGMTSGAEYLDVAFSREVPESFTSAMNAILPEGLSILAAAPIRNEAPSLSSVLEVADYEVWFPEGLAEAVFGDPSPDSLRERLSERVKEIMASSTVLVNKVRKDRTETLNVRPSLIRAEVKRDAEARPVLNYRLLLNRSDSVRPEALTAALCNWVEFDERLPRVHRSALSIPARQGMLDPLTVVRADFAWWRQPVQGGTVA